MIAIMNICSSVEPAADNDFDLLGNEPQRIYADKPIKAEKLKNVERSEG